jgi:lipopolysaccharide/colanic/teichoic acid biosynthesis glycosyltransferase
MNKTIESKINQYKKNSIILKTSSIFNIQNNTNKVGLIINLGLVNNIRRINKFHEGVNSKLIDSGEYICCGETLEERRSRVWKKAPFGFKNIINTIDFTFKRVIPKLPIFKNIYFMLTRGHNRVMSLTEILGRLISCGFKIVETFEENNIFYIVSKKIDLPDYNMNASYGLFCRFKRLGYKKQFFYIYKIRTMYPYSEYLQAHFFKMKNLNEDGDKIKNDVRLTAWGKFLRKHWIDELPQLWNLIKGDLSIVGVRALSEEKFNLYSKDLQDLRSKFKPGILPPYYADLPSNFKEFELSEKKYLLAKLDKRIQTDFKYFFKIIFNIIFKNVRSS